MSFRQDLRGRAAAVGGRLVLVVGWDHLVREAAVAITAQGMATIEVLDARGPRRR